MPFFSSQALLWLPLFSHVYFATFQICICWHWQNGWKNVPHKYLPSTTIIWCPSQTNVPSWELWDPGRRLWNHYAVQGQRELCWEGRLYLGWLTNHDGHRSRAWFGTPWESSYIHIWLRSVTSIIGQGTQDDYTGYRNTDLVWLCTLKWSVSPWRWPCQTCSDYRFWNDLVIDL